MTHDRDAVTVTGIGLVTPIGTKLTEVFDAACHGPSGLRRPPDDHPVAGCVEAAGIVTGFDPTGLLPPTELRTVDRYIQLALAAADAAVADAGLAVGTDVDPYRIACLVSGVGGLSTMESVVVARTGKGRLGVTPYLLPGMLPNMGAARIALRHGIRGHTSSLATACAAGAQSLGEALRLLRHGEADVVVCGGVDAPLLATVADSFGNARTLARGWTDPAVASRPFDRRRNGMVLSEGATVFVLERAEHADARGAAGHADLAGWGSTTDAHHPTTPRPDGQAAAECMRQALRDAGVPADAVGYLNAHGTGTRLGDVAEARAVRAAFAGLDGPAVSSTKGVTGHLLGASGAMEAAITIEAVRRGLLPPTHNLDEPDPACPLDHVRGQPRPAPVGYAMSNTFGFGGHNVSLVFRPPSTRTARSG